MLSTHDHSRSSAGLEYVYPVMSRRSGGLSIGINLNPNNACNWQCIYCQVPNLLRGKAPEIDKGKLAAELHQLLDNAINGDFYDRFKISEDARFIRDIAISGNGEPTSAVEFDQIIDVIAGVVNTFTWQTPVNLVLITNGSLMQRLTVQQGLAKLSRLQGEVWFKLDSATDKGIQKINHVKLSIARVRKHLSIVANICPTWLQTCVFAYRGEPPVISEVQAYLHFLGQLLKEGIAIQGVLLYGIARPSLQEEAPLLSVLPKQWLNDFADNIRALGLTVRVTP